MNPSDLKPEDIVTVSSPCVPFSYRPPIENVCACGRKHTGPFSTCSSCSQKD